MSSIELNPLQTQKRFEEVFSNKNEKKICRMKIFCDLDRYSSFGLKEMI
jgi:hypothetical protein